MQPVSIYGRHFTLQKTGARQYSVVDPRTGALIARAYSRFLAVANAAKLLRNGP
jgi:hypothetical protein